MTIRPLAAAAVFLGLGAAVAVSAATFSDTAASPYGGAIEGLLGRGIVEGYADETFRPENRINRAEFLKILMESRFPGRTPKDLRCFPDLDVQTPQWYARTTCAAAELGIVSGYPDGFFRPEKNVNLAEALKMAFGTFGMTVSATGGEWYEPYLNEARRRSILLKLLKVPAHQLTRGEMAAITYTLVVAYEHGEEHPTDGAPVCGNGVWEGAEQCDDGNVQDSDGCSGICVLVPEPVRRSILQIDQQASGTLSTVARGQRDIRLLKFTGVSGRQDSLLTSLIFQPSTGSLYYAQNYELMMDRNGDGTYETVAQSNGKVESGRLIFDQMVGGGILLSKELIVPFVVRADLGSTLGPVTIGLEFATGLPDYVEARGATDGLEIEGIETDNVCVSGNCFIRVNTQASTDITVEDKGNLFVTEDTLATRSHILLGSTYTDALMRLRLRAEGESIDVQTLKIDGVVSSVESLLLYKLAPGEAWSAGMSPFAQASHGQCPDEVATRFCAILPLSTVVISTSQDMVIVIAARMKSDVSGGVSGQPMTLTINSGTTPSTKAVEARGVASAQDLAQNDADSSSEGEIFIGTQTPTGSAQITGRTSDTALATIGVITREGPAEESFIPTGFVPVGNFKVSAFPHGNTFHGSKDVVIRTIVFRVNAQNVLIDPLSFRLTTRDYPETQLSCIAGASTGSFDVTCSGLESGTIQSRIGQGLNLVYVLSANVTNSQVNAGTSTLQVVLPTLGQRNQTNSILWSDQSTDFSWVDIAETSVGGTVYRR